MSLFVQIASFSSASGKFDEDKDTRNINEKMQYLQDNGAKIIGVNLSIAGSAGTSAVYIITYEANAPIYKQQVY